VLLLRSFGMWLDVLDVRPVDGFFGHMGVEFGAHRHPTGASRTRTAESGGLRSVKRAVHRGGDRTQSALIAFAHHPDGLLEVSPPVVKPVGGQRRRCTQVKRLRATFVAAASVRAGRPVDRKAELGQGVDRNLADFGGGITTLSYDIC